MAGLPDSLRTLALPTVAVVPGRTEAERASPVECACNFHVTKRVLWDVGLACGRANSGTGKAGPLGSAMHQTKQPGPELCIFSAESRSD